MGIVTAPRVLVARPYPTQLRARMFDVLRGIGLDMDSATIVPSGTSDEEAIATIVKTAPEVLLVPFNAHRDADGGMLDGLTLCGRLARHPDAPAMPVIMPVSRMAAANLRLSSSAGEHAELYAELLRTRILVFEDEQLDEPDAPRRVRTHLRQHGVVLRSTS